MDYCGTRINSLSLSLWAAAVRSLAGVDAVSAALMVHALYNEYSREPSIGATSEWVVTFPTKRFYVDDVTYGGTAILPPVRGGLATAWGAGLGASARFRVPTSAALSWPAAWRRLSSAICMS